MSQLRAGAVNPAPTVRYAGVPTRVAQAWPRMSPRLRALVRLCDGHRAVNEICAVSEIGAEQAELALAALARAGLIVDATTLEPRAATATLSTWMVATTPAANTQTAEAAGPQRRMTARAEAPPKPPRERRPVDGKARTPAEVVSFTPEEEAFFSAEMPAEIDEDDPRLL